MHLEKKEKKLAILGICSFLLYMFLQEFQILPLYLLGIDISKMSSFWKIIYLSIYEIIFLYLYCIENRIIHMPFVLSNLPSFPRQIPVRKHVYIDLLLDKSFQVPL